MKHLPCHPKKRRAIYQQMLDSGQRTLETLAISLGTKPKHLQKFLDENDPVKDEKKWQKALETCFKNNPKMTEKEIKEKLGLK